jgi:hypothetical protein
MDRDRYRCQRKHGGEVRDGGDTKYAETRHGVILAFTPLSNSSSVRFNARFASFDKSTLVTRGLFTM